MKKQVRRLLHSDNVACVEMERSIEKVFGGIINQSCHWLDIARMTGFAQRHLLMNLHTTGS